jgi:hypothetical protein
MLNIDDDDNFETIIGIDGKPTQVLKDGARLRVPLSMRDSALAQDRLPLHDGRGNPCGHRPGYLVADDSAARDARLRAYQDYESDLTNAWRSPTPDAEGYDPDDIGEPCTCKGEDFPLDFGSPGTIKRVGSRIICVPNKRRTAPDPASDRRSVADAYREYDNELRNAWRNP